MTETQFAYAALTPEGPVQEITARRLASALNDRYDLLGVSAIDPADIVQDGDGWTIDGMDPWEWADALYGDQD
jgi:hypothetical protein